MVQRTKKFMLTKEGLAQLRSEYDELSKIQRPAVIKRIEDAREFGDLAENSEYDAAKEAQSLLETRIQELEEVLHRNQIIEKEHKTDFVVIGSTVVVEVEGHEDEFTIVGTMEANPIKRMISNESPLGATLLGAKVGEEIEVVTPIVRAKYKIKKIK
ncbi:transcription elongation factor GreA [Candidatus Curtissbacteria bacterium]|nr:transcription elongation factor GreA [Candidatus Curtissbacteria bacterium]